jgi:GxxExxY protein
VELSLRGLTCDRQVSIPLEYRGRPLKGVYRLDLLVENEVIVEVKAVETVLPVHEAQLLSYLKLCRKKKGLLLNFNVPVLREGIIRRVN